MRAKPIGVVDELLERLASLGDLDARRMFGGWGVYCDGLMFAIVVDDRVYLKVDDETRSRFEDEGLARLTYRRSGMTRSMSYYELPPDALDAPQDALEWCGLAVGAATRAATKKRPRAKRKKASR